MSVYSVNFQTDSRLRALKSAASYKSDSSSSANQAGQRTEISDIDREVLFLKKELALILGPKGITSKNPAYTDQERLGILKKAIKLAKRWVQIEERYPSSTHNKALAHDRLAQVYYYYWKNQDYYLKLISLDHYAIMAKHEFETTIKIQSQYIREKLENPSKGKPTNGNYLQLAMEYRRLAGLLYDLNEIQSADYAVEQSKQTYQCSNEYLDGDTNEKHNVQNSLYHKASSVLNLELSFDSSKKLNQILFPTIKFGGLEFLRRALFEKADVLNFLKGALEKSPDNKLFKVVLGTLKNVKGFKLFYVLEITQIADLLFAALAASESTAGLSRFYEQCKNNLGETISNFSWKLVKKINYFGWP